MFHTADNINHPEEHLQSLLKLFSMFKIRILYNDTIGLEYVPEYVGIMHSNCGKIISCSLDNQHTEKCITSFFHKYGLLACWFILDHQIEQRPKFLIPTALFLLVNEQYMI